MADCTFEEVINHEMIHHWMDGHRLGLAAAVLHVDYPNRTALKKAKILIEESLNKIDQKTREAWLASYPLSSLDQLRKLASKEKSPWGRYGISEEAKHKSTLTIRKINELKNQQKNQRFCIIQAEEQIRHMVFHSNTEVLQLRRLVIANHSGWFRLNRQEWEPLEEPLSPHLDTLRASWLSGQDTIARVNAAAKLAPIFYKQGKRWFKRRVVAGICDRLFAWPLLLIGEDKREAISLPIGVDIAILPDQAGKEKIRILATHGDAVIDVSDWKASFPRILETVQAIFRYSQGDSPPDWQDRLQVTLDLRFAEAIVEGLVSVSLLGRSMEVYLAGVILSRLLGMPATPQSTATGSIGEGNPLLAEFIWPAGVPQKLDYVFSACTFDRVIVPAGQGDVIDEYLAEARDYQTASVLHAGRVMTALKILGGPLATPHQYVRCPELLIGSKYNSTHLRLHSLRNALGKKIFVDLNLSQSATLDVTARDVLFLLQQRHQQKSRSWLFVLLYEDEPDETLWELIGEAIGASEAELSSLLLARTPRELAACLAQMLVWGMRKNDFRRATPDVIVIVGGSERVALYDKTPDKSAYPHALRPVLDELAMLEMQTRHRRSDDVLGSTKIILTSIKGIDSSASEGLSRDEEPAWLDRFRVFRGAFDMQCAAFLLEDLIQSGILQSGIGIRMILEEAVSKGWLIKLPDGDFLVSYQRGTPINIKGDELSRLHFRAGRAFAPQLAPNIQRVGIPTSEVSRVVNILEAQYHFSKAPQVRDTLRGKYKDRTDLVFLHRFFRRRAFSHVINYSLIRQAGLGREILEWLIDDIEDLKASGQPVHPYYFAAIGMCGVDALKHAGKEADKLQQDILKLLEEGVASCNNPEFGSEKDFLLARVVSWYDHFIVQLQEEEGLSHLVTREINSRLSYLNQQVKDSILCGPKFSLASAPIGEWYYQRGEEESNDGKAIILYGMSVIGWPDYHRNWPRFFGTIERVRGKTTVDLDWLMQAALIYLRDNPDFLKDLQVRQQMYRVEEELSATTPFEELGTAFGIDNYRRKRLAEGQRYLVELNPGKIGALLKELEDVLGEPA